MSSIVYQEEDYIELCNEDNNLKLGNLLQYYLEHYDDKEIMDELKWDDPYLYLQIERIHYVKQLKDTTPNFICPECGDEIIQDEDGEEYCNACGLVTRTHYNYVAGIKIELPYGLK